MGHEPHSIDWQAAQWLGRMSRPVLDSDAAAAFDRWILENPRHVESYARMAAMWQSEGLGLALAEPGGAPRPSNDDFDGDGDEPAAPRTWRPRVLQAGAALCLLLFACVLGPRLLVEEAEFATGHGQIRTVTLGDGSTIRMDGETRIAARITPWSRHVALKRGEAFFDVAHERLRGFTVDAGGASVSVLGTAFDIDRMDARTRVIQVYRGLVSVDAGAGRQWRLPAGSGLELSGERVRSLRGVEGDRPGWTQGWFEANDTPVAQLVQRLNRASPRKVVLADPALGELLVTGRFQTGDAQGVLDAVAAIHDLHWRRTADRYVLER
ncbi:FecR family protein [Novosphingobium resinovorum]|uniref:FecR family protein n=1 Tax=Novosphingobium resinovorum TaxID=158500 RepID=UPI002ED3157F|nr:FecR domain-containing protein [Novosphingobium resinovorum]